MTIERPMFPPAAEIPAPAPAISDKPSFDSEGLSNRARIGARCPPAKNNGAASVPFTCAGSDVNSSVKRSFPDDRLGSPRDALSDQAADLQVDPGGPQTCEYPAICGIKPRRRVGDPMTGLSSSLIESGPRILAEDHTHIVLAVRIAKADVRHLFTRYGPLLAALADVAPNEPSIAADRLGSG